MVSLPGPASLTVSQSSSAYSCMTLDFTSLGLSLPICKIGIKPFLWGDPWVGKILGVGNSNPLQYSCLGNTMDRGSLVGYSPWGCKESDMTEQLNKGCLERCLVCTKVSVHTRFYS